MTTLAQLAGMQLAERRPELYFSGWRKTARPEQLTPDGYWATWIVCAGRGWGKTRVGAETVRYWAMTEPGVRIALVGATAADVRDVMVEGESGILACCGEDRPEYLPSMRRLVWANGSVATTFSAEEPNRLRGPQFHKAWPDEIAAWAVPETWDMLQMGLRLGINPQSVVTTTPRPTPLMKRLLAGANTIVTRGRTYDNAANLAPGFLAAVERQYANTRLGRQELEAELLTDSENALWKRADIDDNRRDAEDLVRIVVGVDPAISNNSGSDETGIVVAGIDDSGQLYVLADYSGKYSPDAWGRRVVAAFDEFQADRVVAEVNQGGDMVKHVLQTVRPDLPITKVHASRGKHARMEPIAALYEQRRVSHPLRPLERLEDQMLTWEPGSRQSPDRVDSLVWALSALHKSANVDDYARWHNDGAISPRRF